MEKDDLIRRIREIRARERAVLKPSPYLRKSYTDEYGEEKETSIRNYQAQGIMNLLMMERMILGDDTGLGKTIQVISAIGYIWMKEPEYVPIIITTKSALYQWGSEINKFMCGMEAVTVYGEPHERHAVYEEFFRDYDPDKKRVLILTYDNVMKDMDRSVIRDRSEKPEKQAKKNLIAARKSKKTSVEKFNQIKKSFESHFDGRTFDIHEYIRETLLMLDAHGTVDNLKKPGGWDSADETSLSRYIESREDVKACEHEVLKLNNEVAPPKEVNGIIDYVKFMKLNHKNIKIMLVMDEVHKLKNSKSQFHEKTRNLSLESQRLVGMTATPVKNRLMEFWSLFRIVKPDLFPKITHFQNEFCITRFQPIGGGRQVPIVVGYRNLDKFVERVEPFYLSRKKYDVAKELPALISQEVECELYDVQEELYDMAETGAADRLDNEDSNGGEILAALTMVQQAVDSPQLIMDENGDPFDGPSSKVDSLIELLENEICGQKVIIFSKFEKMITIIESSLKEAKYIDDDGRDRKGYRYVRITGKESDAKIRDKHKNLFQDPNSGINIVLITMAGSESINLHAAEHLVFIDLPWSWGDYVQLTGRYIRIGSTHKAVCAYHFLGKRKNGEKTIDHHVLQALRGKKKLADKVAGESIKGGLQFVSGDVVNDVMSMIRKSQDGKKAGDKGTLLASVNEKLALATSKKPVKSRKESVVNDVPVLSVDIDFSDI